MTKTTLQLFEQSLNLENETKDHDHMKDENFVRQHSYLLDITRPCHLPFEIYSLYR